MDIQQFLSILQKDMLQTKVLKIPVADAKSKGLCASCGHPAMGNCYSDAGGREYQISGICERCFDRATKEEE